MEDGTSPIQRTFGIDRLLAMPNQIAPRLGGSKTVNFVGRTRDRDRFKTAILIDTPDEIREVQLVGNPRKLVSRRLVRNFLSILDIPRAKLGIVRISSRGSLGGIAKASSLELSSENMIRLWPSSPVVTDPQFSIVSKIVQIYLLSQ